MRKSSLLAWIVLAGSLVGITLLAFAHWRSFQTSPTTAESAAANEGFATRLILSPCKLGNGLYLFGHLEPAAVYVIETDEGLVMVDTGLEAEYGKIAQAMTRLGLDLMQLKMILLTHVHGDHTMGAERLRQETGARVYIGREDAPPLRDGGPRDAIFSTFDMPGVTAHPTQVDSELVDGQMLTLGNTRIKAIATPGHTLGSLCYLVEHRGMRILCTGDTVMSLADGLGTYSTYLPPRFRGDVAAYLGSLKKLRAMPKPDIVLPGHPGSDPIPQNPRVSEQQWSELLDRGIAELEQLAARYVQDGADFLDGTPKQLARGLYYLGDLDGHAAYARLSETETMLFDAADRDALTFLASAWRKLEVEPPPVTAVLLTSCRAENIAGLKELLEATGCRVVTSPAGAGALTRNFPDARVAMTGDLEPLNLPGMNAMATPGRDDTAATYYFQIDGEEVVVTGEFLFESSDVQSQQVLVDGALQTWNLTAFQNSLSALDRLRPKLWLSAHPLRGRNANLYDDEWLHLLSRNAMALRQLRRMSVAR